MNLIRTSFVLAAAVFAAASCSSTETHSDRPVPVRVLVYNVRHCEGLDGRVDLERVAEVIREADANVVLLQEVDQCCERSGGTDQAAKLGELVGMDHRFGTFRSYDGGHYGMAALSMFPIVSTQTIQLPPDAKRVAALEVVIEAQDTEVVVTGLHLVQTEDERLAQARYLLEHYEDEKRPVIFGGDLNSERNSSVLAALYTAFDAPEKRGDALTFPSDQPIKEIDYVLLRPRNRWVIDEHRVIDEALASDHRPVMLQAHLRY
ncbi:MAG: endonuclease/exonuclease/phosphatase family protein [Planctomycetota bacterium]